MRGGGNRFAPLSQVKWDEFEINDLFDIKIGKNLNGNKINKTQGKTAYITRKVTENGIDGFVDADNEYKTPHYPVITIGNETAKPFVQTFPFYTGTKVNILKAKQKYSTETLSFISRCLEMQKNKYSYSFTVNSTRLEKQKILLPVTAQGEPDYAYMENYAKHLEKQKLIAYCQHQGF